MAISILGTPLRECMRRDAKGLYQAVREGKISYVTGIDSPYQAPLQPEYVVDTRVDSGDQFIDRLLWRLLKTRSQTGLYQAFTASHALAR